MLHPHTTSTEFLKLRESKNGKKKTGLKIIILDVDLKMPILYGFEKLQ